MPTQLLSRSSYATAEHGPAGTGRRPRALRSLGVVALVCGAMMTAHAAFASDNAGDGRQATGHAAAVWSGDHHSGDGVGNARPDSKVSGGEGGKDHAAAAVAAVPVVILYPIPEARTGECEPSREHDADDAKDDVCDRDTSDDDDHHAPKPSPAPNATPAATPSPTATPIASPASTPPAITGVVQGLPIPTPMATPTPTPAATPTAGSVQGAATPAPVPATGASPALGLGFLLMLLGLLMLVIERRGSPEPRRTDWGDWAY